MSDNVCNLPWQAIERPKVSPQPESTEGVDLEWLQETKAVRELEGLLAQRKAMRTEEEEAEAWSKAATDLKTYSDNMIHRWNKEIDVYLVFAALFSAILTTFNVESYKLLQSSPPDNTVIASVKCAPVFVVLCRDSKINKT